MAIDRNHPKPGTIIGYPYAGTHGVDYNKRGGSDNWQSENAVDIWLFPGTAVTAIDAGIVSPAGWGYGLSKKGGRFAGWRLHLVTSPNAPTVAFYTHLRELIVKPGQHVQAGQVLGYSGVANGTPHLHFAVEPPYAPGTWAARSYSLSDLDHKPPTVKSGGGFGGQGQQTNQPPQSIEDAWHELMRALHFTWADATNHIRESRQRIAQAVN